MNVISLFITLVNIVRITATVARVNTSGTTHPGRSPVNIHHGLYYYHPPSHITFTCRYCTHPDTYPVYHGLAPAYVFRYYEEAGRYRDLLAGLALYNLGRASVDRYHLNHFIYAPVPDDKCSLQVIDNKHFDETRFDCVIMSTFLNQAKDVGADGNSINITSLHLPVQIYRNNMFRMEITNAQVCMLWHNKTMVKERKDVPCGLLLKYSNTLVPPTVPVYVWMPTLFAVVIIITLVCQACKKTKETKVNSSTNDTVIGYRANLRVD